MLDMLLLVGTLFMGTELKNRTVIWNNLDLEGHALYSHNNFLRIKLNIERKINFCFAADGNKVGPFICF